MLLPLPKTRAREPAHAAFGLPGNAIMKLHQHGARAWTPKVLSQQRGRFRSATGTGSMPRRPALQCSRRRRARHVAQLGTAVDHAGVEHRGAPADILAIGARDARARRSAECGRQGVKSCAESTVPSAVRRTAPACAAGLRDSRPCAVVVALPRTRVPSTRAIAVVNRRR
jgi:hypothetical protein